jgi:hypothetical protein
VPPLSIDALDGGCPVTIVTVAVAEFCPVSVTDVGFTEQVEFCGVPVHASVTVPVEPFNGRIESMKVAVCPSVMVAVFDPLTVIEKSSPPPERAITAGEFSSVALTDSNPAREPDCVGTKTTLTWHCAPIASVCPHVLVPEGIAKSPVTPAFTLVSGTPPLLVSVTV